MSRTRPLIVVLAAAALGLTPTEARAQYACTEGNATNFGTACRIGSATFSDWSFGGTAAGTVKIKPINQTSLAGNIGFWVDDAMDFNPSIDTPLGTLCGPVVNPGGSGFCSSNSNPDIRQTYAYYRKTLTVAVTITPDVVGSMFISGVSLDRSGTTQYLSNYFSPGTLQYRQDWNVNGSQVSETYNLPVSFIDGNVSTLCFNSCFLGNGPRPTSPFRFTNTFDFYYQVPIGPDGTSASPSMTSASAIYWAGENLNASNPLPPDPTVVPEPSTLLLSASGLALLLMARGRRRTRAHRDHRERERAAAVALQ